METVAYIFKNGNKTEEDAGASLLELRNAESCPTAYLIDHRTGKRHVGGGFTLVAGASYDWVVPAPIVSSAQKRACMFNQEAKRAKRPKTIVDDWSDKDAREICRLKGMSFVKWLSKSPLSAVAEVTRRRTPLALKLLRNKKLFENEKEVLECLGGQHHTIKLQGSFAFEEYKCYGLWFKKYGDAFCPETELELCSYMLQLLKALNFCHELNYAHRDVKPNNILVSRDGSCLEVVLADFGLATQIDHELTTVGTIPYMPPEMLIISCEYGLNVDVWSAGIVFMELLFGCQIFPADTMEALRSMQTVFAEDKDAFIQSAPKFPGLWSRLKSLTFKMLEIDPDKRITSKEALHTLEAEIASVQ